MEGRKSHRYLWELFALTFLIGGLTLFLGRYPHPGFSFDLTTRLSRTIILSVRLPRILLAILAGAMLSAAGFTFQMIFSNPLVEPGFLGVSQGAAFGAALVIIYIGYQPALLQASAIFFALLALFLAYTLARHFRFGGWLLRLVLSGIAVSAIFSSMLSALKLVADPTKDLQDITFWMMGGLWNATWARLLSILPLALPCLLILFLFRWKLNLLSLDEKTAFAMGASPKRERIFLLTVATVGTTMIISVTGLIGWIGLIIPHLSRKLMGSDSTVALPGSMLIGAIFMLLCDSFGRSAFASELPIGLITSSVGALIFIIILSQKKQGGKL
ncbi:MAG: iron ABC transporter permease [Spirochaetia bacterium]|jgi:iron complex transport system permease protein|nr:iron ABC transporter permease [Spirochaetia bacterium]